jgi:hypothetical protein
MIFVLYIHEPIEKWFNGNYVLYKEDFFYKIYGTISHDGEKQYKLPLYNTYYFSKTYFQDINNSVKTTDLSTKQFCCLINKHDKFNTRTPVYDRIIALGHIVCPSNLFNNCSNEELNKVGNVNYISNFIFNLCSENSISTIGGYITEKLGNCCKAGSIPIYCGNFDDIDAEIFNTNRILFYDPYDPTSVESVYTKVKELIEDPELLKIFYSQDVFCETAYETSQWMFNNVKTMFDEL